MAVSGLAVIGGLLVMGASPPPAHAETCTGDLSAASVNIGATEAEDLLVSHECRVVGPGPFIFRHVNIVDGGKLIFVEPPDEPKTVKGQDFFATSIIIESGGALVAGSETSPYGVNNKTLTIHLYGADPRGGDPTKSEGPGVSCVKVADPAKFADCGIPKEAVWDTNGSKELTDLPGGVTDRFYQYGNMHGDSGTVPETGQAGHFGYKMLALSYNGTLELHGAKGTTGTSPSDIATLIKPVTALSAADEKVITSSGTDWGRLAGVDGATITLDRSVGDWRPGDEIVVSSTDYLPEHAETRTIVAVDGATVTLDKPLTYQHNFTAYNVAEKLGTAPSSFRTAVSATDGGTSPILDKVETRATVGLLTRSIRIVSEGDTPKETFAQATARDPHYMYGGHVVFRQGFKALHIQGVEFHQLGQGGLMGRYPVHFHIARKVPAGTYVIDSSINESMTRWVVIHSTIGVTVARDVGWKSIGHGYFLEDGTETDNKFYSDLGVFVRASVPGGENPRNIPGLLDARNLQNVLPLKYHSDAQYPTTFWITNGWNAFVGNAAAGAGSCGACFWYVPAGNHDMMDVPPSGAPMTPMQWSGYSAIQASPKGPGDNARAGLSPVQLFYKNSCSTAMHSLSVTDETPCQQIQAGVVTPVPNKRAPDAVVDQGAESDASRMVYPRYSGLRNPTQCDPTAADGTADSCQVAICNYKDPKYCVPSVFSHYSSSFNWAGINFSAIWLRSGYLLLDHNFLSDVQGPGVTFVTGGDYSRSNLPKGYWGLVTNSIFAGQTQPKDSYALAKGPVDADGKPACRNTTGVCYDDTSAIAFPLTNFSTAQRLYNVYDGPAYEDANAFLDVHPSPCKSTADCMYAGTLGVLVAGNGVPDVKPGEGYLPNAAIAWKQSNGFYYPPAFHSRNLYFGGVDLRHYVIEPLTYPGTYRTDTKTAWARYAASTGNTAAFRNWSDVDRQTELSDDDGSLTGFSSTVSVNEDKFFAAPTQTSECRSAVGVDASNACAGQTPPNPPTARTSPYEHLTTVVYPDPATLDGGMWSSECSNENCFGVPIYREYLTGTKGEDAAGSTREWRTWLANKCDEKLAALQGKIRPVGGNDPYGQPAPTPSGDKIPVTPLLPSLTPFQQFQMICQPPFVRMAGMNLGQRSVLTVNNGRYYIDTTISQDYQQKSNELMPDTAGSRFINVFQGGKSYYLFFLFAKHDMKQTYEIYGGDGFTDASVSGVQVDVSTMPLPASAITAWSKKPFWTVKPGKRPGVLDIEVDFSKVPAELLDPRHLSSTLTDLDETCEPHTFCSKTAEGSGARCGCDTSKLGALGLLNSNFVNVCKNVCEHWAVKDLDCPSSGCLGIKFTLPGSFVANDRFELPVPQAYPATPWTAIKFAPTASQPDSAPTDAGCHYTAAQTPNDASSTCKVAD